MNQWSLSAHVGGRILEKNRQQTKVLRCKEMRRVHDVKEASEQRGDV